MLFRSKTDELIIRNDPTKLVNVWLELNINVSKNRLEKIVVIAVIEIVVVLSYNKITAYYPWGRSTREKVKKYRTVFQLVRVGCSHVDLVQWIPDLHFIGWWKMKILSKRNLGTIETLIN